MMTHSCSPTKAFRTILSVLMSFVLLLAFGAQAATMTAHFIDVGQGDATLLEFPCGAVLIDAGAQDKAHIPVLVDYLKNFFTRRTDLNETIDTLFITHTHEDHNLALPEVVRDFKVKNYVDNGIVKYGGGKEAAQWIRKPGSFDGPIRTVADAEVVAVEHPESGLTDGVIDPVRCEDCDPKIAVFSGWVTGHSDWDSKNQNNQSLVIRVDFGETSFLFTGDLEEDARELLLNYYNEEVAVPQALDVDVYHVGHHGAVNGTDKELLGIMSPAYAVISAGKWYDGKDKSGGKSAWGYGHPNSAVVSLLAKAVSGKRTAPIQATAFKGARKPTTMTVSKNVYSTSWDGTVRLAADTSGAINVITSN